MTTTDRTPTLADTERHLLTWCFSPQPEPTALTALGQQQDERWAHYRNAVRRQLARVCEVALPRCNRLAPHWDTWLTEFFAKAPPTTRYFWQVPLEFVRYLELREEHAAQELADLFRLEAAQWEVKNTANRDSPLLTDFDFSGIAVLNHTLQLLELSTPAHRIPVEEAPDQPSAQDNAAPSARMPSRYRLAIFRDIHSHEPATWELNLSSFILLELLAQSERSIAEAAQAAAAHLSIPFDQHYLEGLSDFFAKALGAGLVLGIAADE